MKLYTGGIGSEGPMELKSNLCSTKDMDMSLKAATTCRPLFLHKNAIA